MIEKNTVLAEDVLGRGVVKDFYKAMGISKRLANEAKLALVYFAFEPSTVRVTMHRERFKRLSPELSYQVYCANKIIHVCCSLAAQTSRNFALTEISSGRFPVFMTVAEQEAFGLPVKRQAITCSQQDKVLPSQVILN